MTFVINLTSLIISYAVANFAGGRITHYIPKGKEFNVGLACSIGILIIFMTKDFWFPSDKSSLYNAIGFGLASGVTTSITSYGLKRK